MWRCRSDFHRSIISAMRVRVFSEMDGRFRCGKELLDFRGMETGSDYCFIFFIIIAVNGIFQVQRCAL